MRVVGGAAQLGMVHEQQVGRVHDGQGADEQLGRPRPHARAVVRVGEIGRGGGEERHRRAGAAARRTHVEHDPELGAALRLQAQRVHAAAGARPARSWSGSGASRRRRDRRRGSGSRRTAAGARRQSISVPSQLWPVTARLGAFTVRPCRWLGERSVTRSVPMSAAKSHSPSASGVGDVVPAPSRRPPARPA